MDRCADCNAVAPWCWLGSLGRCDQLAEPHWARHNAARSPLGPPPTAPPETVATPEDPAEAARLRRAAKPRVSKGCGECHGKPPTTDQPAGESGRSGE